MHNHNIKSPCTSGGKYRGVPTIDVLKTAPPPDFWNLADKPKSVVKVYATLCPLLQIWVIKDDSLAFDWLLNWLLNWLPDWLTDWLTDQQFGGCRNGRARGFRVWDRDGRYLSYDNAPNLRIGVCAYFHKSIKIVNIFTLPNMVEQLAN